MSPFCLDIEALSPCADILIDLIKQALGFLQSDDGRYFFASIATLKAIFYYLRRSPLPEAQDLADVLTAALAMMIIIAAMENQIAIKNALLCRSAPSEHSKSEPHLQENAKH